MAISTRQVKNKRDSNGVLTGRPGTVYDVNIKYTAPDGKKKSYAKKGFATKKEAAQHEAEMKTKLQNPGQVASITSQRKQTVAAYLNDWVESYARVNLRPSTYDGYKKTIANYINPYIGGVALNQLTPAMVDKMFQQIIDKGLKPSTAAGAKRVLSVALSHARKYRYIETNAAKDTLTKFGKGDKTPDPYTPEQVKALMQRVEGTVWEMPVILGGLYGMRRSEILGLRWRNVDLENNTFDVTEQLPFKVPPKTKVIEEMAPPKSNGRKLPITELARPFFLKQLAMQEVQKEQAAKDGKPYYDNDLVVAKPDGAPIAASWVSSQFGKLLADSVKGIIAQRLVRRLCPACKREHLLTEEEKAFMNIPAFRPVKIYEPCGCEKCANTGYKGRIGIYEIMTVTPKLKSLISKCADIEDINKAACDEGMHTLRQSAEKLVLEGVTSFQEMLKTTFEN